MDARNLPAEVMTFYRRLDGRLRPEFPALAALRAASASRAR